MAVLLVGVLHLISDAEDPYGIARKLMAATTTGSYLVITHPASDIDAAVVAEGARRYNAHVSTAQTRRTLAETARFVEDLDLVEPGVVQCHRWRPGPAAANLDEDQAAYAAIGRKT